MTYHRQDKPWTERTGYAPADAAPTDDIDRLMKRQAFHHASTSLGGAHTLLGIGGHWVGLAGTLAPIVIGEFISDPAKRWRAVKLSAVGTALAYEILHTARELERRKEARAKLAECQSRGG
jgi:hypothetical protein